VSTFKHLNLNMVDFDPNSFYGNIFADLSVFVCNTLVDVGTAEPN